jgi:hypothetical protein
MSTAPRTVQLTFARPAALALLGAIAFPAFYLAMDLVGAPPLPMPGAPAAEVYSYLVENGSSVVLTGLVQLVSGAGLLAFVRSARRLLDSSVWAERAGLLAVLMLAVSTAVGLVLAATASSLTADTVNVLRTTSFLAGGVLHVMSLGGYVRLTSLALPGRGIRVFGLIATVPALLSVTSLAFFQASALILLGRILCMLWIVTAGITLFRATRKAVR